MILSDVAIRNRVSVAVLAVLIVAGGVYSYVTLPREAAPDVPIPRILITATYEGVAPEDVESSVTMKIEKKLAGLKGVKEVTSTSGEGISFIACEFHPDVRVEDALRRVKDKVDQARGDLPGDVKDPSVDEINVAEFPIIYINISGDSLVRLKAIADDLQDRLESVPGVLQADVLGAPQREIRLEIDPDRIAAYGLSAPEILRLIPSENVNISAGGLETPGTKFNVRVPAEFVEPGQVEHLLLTVRNGRPVYLTDVARVTDTFKDRDSYSRLDGADSITVSVRKRVGANIVVIAETVKAILAAARKVVPAGVKFDLTLDQSKDIGMMIGDLENNMAAAFVLVLVILFVFMGWRSSVIVAAAVPMSMCMTFAILQMMGYTLNMIVLFSLVLSVGMLVDNAVVIVENVYRHRQLGYGRIEAAMKGTAEVAWPVITSTITTVVAFLPMLFWGGIIGDFMKYLPITVIVALTCSLFVAMVISPVMCTLTRGGVRRRQLDNPFIRGYRRFLQAALSHRFVTIALAVLLLVAMLLLYGKQRLGVEFMPDIDPKNAVVNIRAPQGANIAETDRLTRLVEQRLAKHRHETEHVVANVGSAGGMQALFGGSTGGPHLANVTMMFPDFEVRKRPSADVVAAVRRELTDLAGAEIQVEKEKHGPPTGAPVTIRFLGDDFKTLEDLSGQARRMIADVPGLVNLRSDLEATRPELVFHVDRRRAMLLGVNTALIGNFLKTAVLGSKVGTYRQFNDEFDITVRLPLSQRTNIEDLFRLRVPNVEGRAVPLSSLGEFDYRGGFGAIHRINQKRVVTLTGDAEGRLAEDVLKDVQARLAKMPLPGGYEIRYAGEKEEMQKAVTFLFTFAFPLALLLILLTLVTQFNTLTVPLIIMTTVPLSLIGALGGLTVNQMPFCVIMTGIGFLSLAGVIVNNAIVLLDYTRKLQQRGLDLVAASVEAGVTRLRPVLLTAAATVIGLVPTALGMSFDFHTFHWATRSESSQWWKNMAVVVIFGMSFATVLTLVVVPSLYVSVYRIAARFGLGGLKKAEAAGAAGATVPSPAGK